MTYFALYNRLQFHPLHSNWFKCIFLNGWVIFHCVYVPWLYYPFICWWTSRLLPCPGYCKQCCKEHWGTCVFFSYGSFPQGICPVVGLLSLTITFQWCNCKPQSIHFSDVFFYLAMPNGMWELRFPDQGSNLCPLQWKFKVLTTGPPVMCC